MTRRRIAVAGAGIGGLAFAALAAASGDKVVVFDQFAAPRPVGSGLVIQPVGQEVLDMIGAGSAARDLGQPVHRLLGHEADRGRAVLDVVYNARGKAPEQDRFGLGIHRASLFHVLFNAAVTAGADIRMDHRVSGRDAQTLEFTDHAPEGPFDLIVDALGAGSPLSPLRAGALGYGAIWGTVPWPDTVLPRDQLSQRYRSAHNMIGALPIGRMPGDGTPLAAVFWSLPVSDYARWCQTPLDTWKTRATALWPEFAPFLTTIRHHDQMTMASYSHGTMLRPAGEGIAHIGDAAHRASPQLGQGANMALLDAHALWSALAGHSLDDALSAYVKARRWHVAIYQTFSAVFTPQYQSDSRILPWVRDWLLMPASRIPPVPAILSRLVCGDLLPPMGSLRPR